MCRVLVVERGSEREGELKEVLKREKDEMHSEFISCMVSILLSLKPHKRTWHGTLCVCKPFEVISLKAALNYRPKRVPFGSRDSF